jgi:maleylacetoacetate isomerase
VAPPACNDDSWRGADRSFGANLADYPTCAAVFKHVSALPEFIAADWKHQPDTPEELRA